VKGISAPIPIYEYRPESEKQPTPDADREVG
jgi:hypothetical protein